MSHHIQAGSLYNIEPMHTDAKVSHFPLKKSVIASLYCIVGGSDAVSVKKAIPARVIFNELRNIACLSATDMRIQQYGYHTSVWSFYSPYIFYNILSALIALLVSLCIIVSCIAVIDSFYFVGCMIVATIFFILFVSIGIVLLLKKWAVRYLDTVYQHNIDIFLRQEVFNIIAEENMWDVSRPSRTEHQNYYNDAYYLQLSAGGSYLLARDNHQNIHMPQTWYKYFELKEV